MNVDITQIESLLEQDKLDEVSALLAQAVTADITDEQRGIGLLGIASIYMDVANAINARYLDSLNAAIEGMKKLNALEKDSDEQDKLESVKKNLGI